MQLPLLPLCDAEHSGLWLIRRVKSTATDPEVFLQPARLGQPHQHDGWNHARDHGVTQGYGYAADQLALAAHLPEQERSEIRYWLVRGLVWAVRAPKKITKENCGASKIVQGRCKGWVVNAAEETTGCHHQDKTFWHGSVALGLVCSQEAAYQSGVIKVDSIITTVASSSRLSDRAGWCVGGHSRETIEKLCAETLRLPIVRRDLKQVRHHNFHDTES